jgi:hypothetical protein
MKTLMLSLSLLCGCTAAAVTADDAITAGCLAAGEEITQAAERGELEPDAARAEHDCLRATCRALHNRIVEGLDDE